MQRKPEEPVNLDTRLEHQRQFLWQILLPIILGTLVFVGLGIAAAITPGDKPAVWANISTIFIAVILMLSGFGSLVLLAGAIFGVDWLTRKIPPASYLVQIYVQYFGRKIHSLADSSVKPMVETKSVWASINLLFMRLRKNIQNLSKKAEG